MTPLLNKIVLITGASAGIGRALVEELVTKGLKVIGLDSDLNKLKVRSIGVKLNKLALLAKKKKN